MAMLVWQNRQNKKQLNSKRILNRDQIAINQHKMANGSSVLCKVLKAQEDIHKG